MIRAEVTASELQAEVQEFSSSLQLLFSLQTPEKNSPSVYRCSRHATEKRGHRGHLELKRRAQCRRSVNTPQLARFCAVQIPRPTASKGFSVVTAPQTQRSERTAIRKITGSGVTRVGAAQKQNHRLVERTGGVLPQRRLKSGGGQPPAGLFTLGVFSELPKHEVSSALSSGVHEVALFGEIAFLAATLWTTKAVCREADY